MKKIMSILMCLAFALCVFGTLAAPAVAQEEEIKVIDCRKDSDCDNGLDLYCSSQPICVKECDDSDSSPECEKEDAFGYCAFEDPCRIYADKPNCDSALDTCVECTKDQQCPTKLQDDEGDSELQVCVNNFCEECAVDDDCDEFAVCENNKCIECDDNQDCIDTNNPAGDFCVEGSCEECIVDADCPAPFQTCNENNECVGEPDCTSDSDCNPGNYPETFCDAPGYCKADGTCDNESTVCEYVWGFTASACVEEDRKCTPCLYNEDGSGDATCAATWEALNTGTGYPVNDVDSSNGSGYPGYYNGELDNATGPICTVGGDCVACEVDADCSSNFCEGSATCNNSGSLSEIQCEFVDGMYDPCLATPETPVCDEPNDRCVECMLVDMLIKPFPEKLGDEAVGATIINGQLLLGDCPEPDNYCNGTITCNEGGLGECGLSGNPCPRTCLPDAEKCDDCKSDADCVGPDFEGKPICQTSDAFDPDTNSCTECKQDSDCGADQVCDIDVDYDYTGDTKDPQNDSACADCLVDEDCVDPALPFCVDRTCVECIEDEACPENLPRCLDELMNPHEGDNRVIAPANFPIPNLELNICVECEQDEDCESGRCLTVDHPEGGETEGEAVFECVECLSDRDCRRDPIGPDACLQDGVCDNESNTCSWTNPCGDKACYPAGYYDEAGRQNVCEDCVRGEIRYFCTDCLNDGDCDDGIFCNGAETCNAREGVCDAAAVADPCAEGQLCDESTDQCLDVECLEDTDCMFYQTCDSANECADVPATCGLKISPKKVKANKIVAGEQKITIKGLKGQSFDASAQLAVMEESVQENSASVTVKKNKRKSLLEATGMGVIQEGSTLTIRLGDCEGTVGIKSQNKSN